MKLVLNEHFRTKSPGPDNILKLNKTRALYGINQLEIPLDISVIATKYFNTNSNSNLIKNLTQAN